MPTSLLSPALVSSLPGTPRCLPSRWSGVQEPSGKGVLLPAPGLAATRFEYRAGLCLEVVSSRVAHSCSCKVVWEGGAEGDAGRHGFVADHRECSAPRELDGRPLKVPRSACLIIPSGTAALWERPVSVYSEAPCPSLQCLCLCLAGEEMGDKEQRHPWG